MSSSPLENTGKNHHSWGAEDAGNNQESKYHCQNCRSIWEQGKCHVKQNSCYSSDSAVRRDAPWHAASAHKKHPHIHPLRLLETSCLIENCIVEVLIQQKLAIVSSCLQFLGLFQIKTKKITVLITCFLKNSLKVHDSKRYKCVSQAHESSRNAAIKT